LKNIKNQALQLLHIELELLTDSSSLISTLVLEGLEMGRALEPCLNLMDFAVPFDQVEVERNPLLLPMTLLTIPYSGN
jgi:hypothetical protein